MDFIDVARIAAEKGSKLLRENFAHSIEFDSKGAHDVVTDIDIRSERLIIDAIRDVFPEHTIHAEEAGITNPGSDYVWYVDPLDGTSNFLIGIPYFSVSIGVAYQGEVIAGVVLNPILNELYESEKGRGALLNGVSIKPSSRDTLATALVASSYSSSEADIKRGLKTIERFALNSRKVVINFSPALDLCNIARGKLDVLVDNGTTSEDHAAGSLILTEAGGMVRNYSESTWNVERVGIIASNSLLQKDAEHLSDE